MEMFEQAFSGEGFFEEPAVEGVGEEFAAENFFEVFLEAALEDDFGGLEGLQEFVGIFGIAFRDIEFTCRDIEKRETEDSVFVIGPALREIDGGQEVIGGTVEESFVCGDAGSNEFRDTPLDDALCHFGIFELIADGDTIAGFDEFMKVGIQGAVGESGQFRGGCGAIVAFGEGYAQHFGGQDGVFAKGFVEIADPEQQDGIGVSLFDRPVLLH